jgi:SAM-dependent methyltransferase
MMITYPDGIPLDICASLLPFHTKLKSLTSLHIHLQAGIKGSDKSTTRNSTSFSVGKLNRIIDHLIGGISALRLNKKISTWSDYYSNTILQDNYFREKEKLVSGLTGKTDFTSAIDLGSNTGEFAIMLENRGSRVIALDIDPLCIERLFIHTAEKKLKITPLVSDLLNPAPALGWDNQERHSLLQRLKADLVLALALVHHLCIGRNLPFEKLAETISQMGKYLIIEFVPKNDEKVQQLLRHREDIFHAYNEENFVLAFNQFFEIVESQKVGNSGRTIFLMKKKID